MSSVSYIFSNAGRRNRTDCFSRSSTTFMHPQSRYVLTRFNGFFFNSMPSNLQLGEPKGSESTFFLWSAPGMEASKGTFFHVVR